MLFCDGFDMSECSNHLLNYRKEEAMVIIIGIVMVLYSCLVIYSNVTAAEYNIKQATDNPWTTFLSGGTNLIGGGELLIHFCLH